VSTVAVKLVIRNYDSITPLLAGDVTAEGIDLEFDRNTPMAAFRTDHSFQAGELSFAQYLRLLDSDQHELVGLPIFVARGFRQRCFFVRSDSGMTTLADLAGKRIGIDTWGATGHTWNRALLREAGVDITQISWSIGPIETSGGQVATDGLPPYAHPAAGGKAQTDLLLSGDLDAVIVSQPPRGFAEPDGPIVRLFPNYRDVEADYAARVGFWPCFHIIGLRADVVAQHPWVTRSLFDAFDRAQKLAAERRLSLADASPWLLAELEQTERLLGPDWQAHGIAPNKMAVATFCDEMFAQGLLNRPIDPRRVFAEYERAAATG
jgi:4,5-dihydroxyphthalate decarboxylase